WNKAGPASSHFICVQSVVVDTRTNTAFITESANGAIIVVDLKSGKARRLLDGHPSTQPEKDVKLVVDGKALIDQQKKMSPQIASDGNRTRCEERPSLLPRAHRSHTLRHQDEFPH